MEGLFEVLVGEGVVGRGAGLGGGDALEFLGEAHDLFVAGHINLPLLLIVLVPDLVEYLEHLFLDLGVEVGLGPFVGAEGGGEGLGLRLRLQMR